MQILRGNCPLIVNIVHLVFWFLVISEFNLYLRVDLFRIQSTLADTINAILMPYFL